jgi:hypothetical protein
VQLLLYFVETTLLKKVLGNVLMLSEGGMGVKNSYSLKEGMVFGETQRL